MNLFTQLRPQWHEASPQHLLEAPVTVLKAVDDARAAALGEVLGVHSVRDMATQPLADWVWRTYCRFRAGAQRDLPQDAPQHVAESWLKRSCGDWLAGPISSLSELDDEQQQRLADAMGWVTVRNMANDTAFEAAREISRVVTGKPVPPDQEMTRPAPEYFAGGTQRYLNKVRESAGLPARPPAPPVPPPPPPAPPAAPPREAAAAELAVEGDVPPAVLATLHPDAASAMPAMPRRPHKDYTADGAYIPRGGGSRGWLENEGVARNERPNRYRYSEAVDGVRFRHSGLEQQVRANNRGADRKEVRQQVRWSQGADQAPSSGVCLNLSLTGARLRVSRAVTDDATLQVTWVHRDELQGVVVPLMALTGQVVWSQAMPSSSSRPRFDCGLHFDALTPDAEERLTLLLTDRVGDLLERGAPEAPLAD